MNLPGAQWTVAFMLSFDMPLFTFLSGYVLFGREGLSPMQFMRRKVFGLLVPYLAWVAVVMPLRHVPPSGWLSRLGQALVNPHAGYQMWYLWVLFVVFGIFTLARLVSTSDVWLGALGIGVGALLFLPPTTAFGADKLLWLFPFFVLGYLCGGHRESLRRHYAWLAGAGVLAFAALTALQSGGVLPHFATGVGGIATVWALYRLLPSRAISAQAWAGRKTLGIYGGQMMVLSFVIVGSGWLGMVASEVTVVVSATLLAWLLSAWVVTRAAFLGQWPKPDRSAPESGAAARPA